MKILLNIWIIFMVPTLFLILDEEHWGNPWKWLLGQEKVRTWW